MIVLSNKQLEELLPSLAEEHPKSRQLETMVVNRLENRWTWPGTEFVVDKFPDFGVLMCRPIKDSPEYVPWPWGYTVTIYCRNAAALEAAIRREDFVNWTQEVLFWAIAADIFPIVKQRCEELGGTDPAFKENEHAVVHLLEPSYVSKSELPDGFHLGQITEAHAKQITSEWTHGAGHNCLPFFRYLLRHKFPSSGVFTHDGRLVAYILYRVDGSMTHGFVNPDYRRLGLYQVVNYDLMCKTAALGQPVSYASVRSWNEASLRSYDKLGAKRIDPTLYSLKWYSFTPKK